jgi:hypothetical protein
MASPEEDLMRFGRQAVALGAVVLAAACGPGGSSAPAACADGDDAGSASAALRFDGVYQHVVSDYSLYLRFYDDRTVISVSYKGQDPNELAPWFNKRSTIIGKGAYLLEGAAVSFTSSAKEGSVEYQGLVCADSVSLQSHSFINGYRATNAYSFVAVAFTE